MPPMIAEDNESLFVLDNSKNIAKDTNNAPEQPSETTEVIAEVNPAEEKVVVTEEQNTLNQDTNLATPQDTTQTTPNLMANEASAVTVETIHTPKDEAIVDGNNGDTDTAIPAITDNATAVVPGPTVVAASIPSAIPLPAAIAPVVVNNVNANLNAAPLIPTDPRMQMQMQMETTSALPPTDPRAAAGTANVIAASAVPVTAPAVVVAAAETAPAAAALPSLSNFSIPKKDGASLNRAAAEAAEAAAAATAATVTAPKEPFVPTPDDQITCEADLKLPEGVTLPPSIPPQLLGERLQVMLHGLPIQQMKEALSEYNDAVTTKVCFVLHS